ncbi:MAG: DEAD/DEAH box helicase, partial [Rhodoglobus sp.]
ELAAQGMPAGELRELAYRLVVALDREVTPADERALFALPYALTYLRVTGSGDEEEDDDDDDDDDDSQAEGSEEQDEADQDEDDTSNASSQDEQETVAPWHDELAFTVGPGVPPPPDLPYAAIDLRPHQERSMTSLVTWWNDGEQRAGVLCLPTGAGKTRTAVAFALQQVVAAELTVLWLTHRKELTDQAIAAFVEAAPIAGREFTVARFEAGSRRYKGQADVVIASLPTLAWGRHRDHPNIGDLRDIHGSFDLVIIDECHHAPAVTWRKVIQKVVARGRTKLLGLSATPTRSNVSEKAQLWRQFQRVIHEEHILEMVKAGILARPIIHPISTGRTFDADAAEKRDFARFRDLPPSMVKRIANDVQRNKLVVKTYTDAPARWGQTLVFAATVEQAQSLRRDLARTGVSVGELYASAHRDDRVRVLNDFRQRRIRVLINVMLFAEGTDVPGVDSVFIARPTESEILFRQMVGRGLRGPEFDGTRVCNVVAFHDAVRGLEERMDGHLGAIFADQVSALNALGIRPEQQAPPGPLATMPPEPSDADLGAQLARLRATLATMPLGAAAGAAAAAVNLAGWWEVRGRAGRVFLPTMDQ